MFTIRGYYLYVLELSQANDNVIDYLFKYIGAFKFFATGWAIIYDPGL